MAAVTAAIASAGALTPGASAVAVCPDGAPCFYQRGNFTGSISIQSGLPGAPYQINDVANSHFFNGQSLLGQISSIANLTGRTLELYTEPNQGGFGGVVSPGAANLPDGPLNDRVRSVALEPPLSACPANMPCFFEGHGATGSRSVQPALTTINDFANSHFDNGDSLSGRVGSVVNNTDRQLVVFSGTNLTGRSFLVPPHFARDFEEANGFLDHDTRSAQTR